eukprot:sb/3470761/
METIRNELFVPFFWKGNCQVPICGLVLKDQEVSSLITKLTTKLAIDLSAELTTELGAAIRSRALFSDTTLVKLEQWTKKVLFKFKLTKKLVIDEDADFLVGLANRIDSVLGISIVSAVTAKAKTLGIVSSVGGGGASRLGVSGGSGMAMSGGGMSGGGMSGGGMSGGGMSGGGMSGGGGMAMSGGGGMAMGGSGGMKH